MNDKIEVPECAAERRYAVIQSNGNHDYVSATSAQRQYAFIAANTELMSDGTGAYLIARGKND